MLYDRGETTTSGVQLQDGFDGRALAAFFDFFFSSFFHHLHARTMSETRDWYWGLIKKNEKKKTTTRQRNREEQGEREREKERCVRPLSRYSSSRTPGRVSRFERSDWCRRVAPNLCSRSACAPRSTAPSPRRPFDAHALVPTSSHSLSLFLFLSTVVVCSCECTHPFLRAFLSSFALSFSHFFSLPHLILSLPRDRDPNRDREKEVEDFYRCRG